jgi:guanylate kinase
MERIWSKGNVIIFDVDVMGGINLKRIFGDKACSIFIMPPSIAELQKRLEGRGTDAPEVIAKRVAKAEFEISKSPEFDHKVINDDLATAVADTRKIIDCFLAE